MWRRNCSPRPLPSLAPSIRPGMSATTSSCVVDADHAQLRGQGRERVVGDLGLGGRDAADERALAGVREADQRDVGHQLELQAQPALLARLALLGEAGRPPLVAEELGVAPPAPPAGRGQEPVAVAAQVGEDGVAVELVHDRPLGHVDLQVLAPPAVQVLALAVGAAGGAAVGVVAEGEERGHVAVGDEPDVAALAAVAAVGAAVDDRTLPPEADAARPAVAPADVEPALVDEGGHGRSRLPGHPGGPGGSTHFRETVNLG